MFQAPHYHAHIYFEAASKALAEQVVEQAAANFPLQVGRFHERAIGPHYDFSVQLRLAKAELTGLLQWLEQHRQGLSILIHPESEDGNHYLDHTERAHWLGEQRPLRLDMFKRGENA